MDTPFHLSLGRSPTDKACIQAAVEKRARRATRPVGTTHPANPGESRYDIEPSFSRDAKSYDKKRAGEYRHRNRSWRRGRIPQSNIGKLDLTLATRFGVLTVFGRAKRIQHARGPSIRCTAFDLKLPPSVNTAFGGDL